MGLAQRMGRCELAAVGRRTFLKSMTPSPVSSKCSITCFTSALSYRRLRYFRHTLSNSLTEIWPSPFRSKTRNERRSPPGPPSVTAVIFSRICWIARRVSGAAALVFFSVLATPNWSKPAEPAKDRQPWGERGRGQEGPAAAPAAAAAAPAAAPARPRARAPAPAPCGHAGIRVSLTLALAARHREGIAVIKHRLNLPLERLAGRDVRHDVSLVVQGWVHVHP